MKDVYEQAKRDAGCHYNASTQAVTVVAKRGACWMLSVGKVLSLLVAIACERAEEWIQTDDEVEARFPSRNE